MELKAQPTVLITGGSRGIGKALAIGFKNCGYKVYASGTKESSIEWMRDVGIFPLVMNMERQDEIEVGFKRFFDENETLDCLINNAGIAQRRSARNIGIEEFNAIVDINLKGLFIACQTYSRMQPAKQYGNIINISSLAGQRGLKASAIYAASKAAVNNLTQTLALEWAPQFRVNAISPGWIQTQLNEEHLTPEAITKLNNTIPLKRMGLPEDLVGPALFLAGQNSKYITGQIIVVDGGYSIISF